MAISMEQAAQVLISNGYVFEQQAPGMGIALSNGSSMAQISKGCLCLQKQISMAAPGINADAAGCYMVRAYYKLRHCQLENGKLLLPAPYAQELDII